MADEHFYFEYNLNLSWEDMSMNETVDGKLTLGIADFDLSADVFSDPGCQNAFYLIIKKLSFRKHFKYNFQNFIFKMELKQQMK